MNPGQWILIAAVRAYQWTLSPLKAALLGPAARCRFTPSCSDYAREAVRRFGVWRGSHLAVRRLLRCHPWGECGHDPVPTASSAGIAFTTTRKSGMNGSQTTRLEACRR